MNTKKQLRLGIFGNGGQVRKIYLPHLADRQDIKIEWVVGCLCNEQDRNDCPFNSPRWRDVDANCVSEHRDDQNWNILLDRRPVDAVIVSLPNAMHEAAIRAALTRGIPVAVDKPPVICSSACNELVEIALSKNVQFVTLAQRRFEDVYQKMAQQIHKGQLGKIYLINLLFVHGFKPAPDNWRGQRKLAGGGVILDSVYHGLDVLMWMFRQAPDSNGFQPETVSARWQPDPLGEDQVELAATLVVRFRNGCLLNISAASTALTGKSIDENLKIFGSTGVLRYIRDRTDRTDMSAGGLTLQSGEKDEDLLRDGVGQARRAAPLADFLDAVRDNRQEVKSPARDSVIVLKIIEKAYQSAAQDGQPIIL